MKAIACPFCAHVMTETRLSTSDVPGHFIRCGGCGAEGPVKDTPHGALAAWNQRGVTATRPPVTHRIKCWPSYFVEMQLGEKDFEIRANDRDYLAGDTLLLEEWQPEVQRYTGRNCSVLVLKTWSDLPGMQPGYVLMQTAIQ